jgi:hypothetical protein
VTQYPLSVHSDLRMVGQVGAWARSDALLVGLVGGPGLKLLLVGQVGALGLNGLLVGQVSGWARPWTRWAAVTNLMHVCNQYYLRPQQSMSTAGGEVVVTVGSPAE